MAGTGAVQQMQLELGGQSVVGRTCQGVRLIVPC